MSPRAALAGLLCLVSLSATAQVQKDLLRQNRERNERQKLLQEMDSAKNAPAVDVIGLRLGMNFAEAEQIVRKHMQVDRVIRIQRPSIISNDVKIRPYGSGLMFIREDGRETFALLNEEPSTPDKLVAVMRTLALEPGQMPGLALLQSLREKYGLEKRLTSDGTAFEGIWIAAASDNVAAITMRECIDGADRVSPYEIPMTENGLDRPLGRDRTGAMLSGNDRRQLPFQSGLTWNWPKTPRFFLNRDSSSRNFRCLPLIFVIYNNYNQMDQMNVSLVDHELYLPLFRRSEEMLRSGEGIAKPLSHTVPKL
ncbi:hypothetical protein [Methylobacterium symbioticum]|uniref:Uncharacterized protein n=1 Tax=Methylobacterium symbioticum TaxID=2584084 RepID=A0A509EJP2_9HYPH|nr:hypothetical protein [Methylobacterium symbioticum]VUD74597.1 hypothetical protein MET9862_05230 [Methylobacterium symbioticum]